MGVYNHLEVALHLQVPSEACSPVVPSFSPRHWDKEIDTLGDQAKHL